MKMDGGRAAWALAVVAGLVAVQACDAGGSTGAAVCGDGFRAPAEQCDDGNNVAGDGCDPLCHAEVPAVCGDGVVGLGEQCDDGNTIAGDGCDGVCRTEGAPGVCGDGARGAGEECDDGNTEPGDGCDESCRVERAPGACGDGTLDAGEGCDDGNTEPGDGCDGSCEVEAAPGACGDGTLDAGEGCDDGNTEAGDGCDGSCEVEAAPGVCGDGTLDAGEGCDDGDTEPGDGCDGSCQVEAAPGVCGDGTLDAGEGCDDGNTEVGDGCDGSCQVEAAPGVCGDGTLDAGEGCDDGNTEPGDGCDGSCQVEAAPGACGDGTLDAGEGCDDGNTEPGDGCDGFCEVEAAPGVCGDGTLDAGEGCDDGNTEAGDGCDGSCQVEAAPGVCGDGTLDAGEGCDDGNTEVGDGCDGSCQVEAAPGVCGDGTLDAGEGCDDGNTEAGDGCDGSCQVEPPDGVLCATLPPVGGGGCAVTPGDASTLILGEVLAPDVVYHGGQVLIGPAGTILCVGCDCAALAPGARRVTCPTGVVSPGLVNAADHLNYTHDDPAPDSGERYDNRHQWRLGTGGHTQIVAPPGATPAQLAWGELRFLLGGATSTVAASSAAGLLRNLDVAAAQEGLGEPPVYASTFPLGDNDGVDHTATCDYPSMLTAATASTKAATIAAVAQGVDGASHAELQCLTSDVLGGEDLALPNGAFGHAIALDAVDYALLGASGTAVVWQPRSNIRLYGDTAAVTTAARLGVQIALGTDWMLTGSMNVLRELRCADSLNATALDHFFSDRDLWLMVTAHAADVTATLDVLGALATGKVADIAIFDGSEHPAYRAVVAADPQDVLLVLRGGKPLYGDAALISGLVPGGCEALSVCGAAKALCLAQEVGMTYAALQAAAGPVYPAFVCGEPPGEPTCVPARPSSVAGGTVYDGVPAAGDADGDGLPDGSDNCPAVFNPIRPMDGGIQPDTDGDGVGDRCDPCPLDPFLLVCDTIDVEDIDGDGAPTALDNCPATPNPLQTDQDGDGHGDACDACPADPNPGSQACPGAVTLVDLGPAVAPISPGAVVTFSVVLDGPAPAGGVAVALFVDPPDAGSLPPAVVVPAGQSQASFAYIDAGVGAAAHVSATLGGTTVSATLVAAGDGGFVINEVDYDQVDADVAEFVELYNGTASPIDLTGYSLVLVNGASGAPYLTVDLAPGGVLGPGEYLVVGAAALVVPGPTILLPFGALQDNIQNGSPDGLALVGPLGQLVDALSYEGGIKAATIPGVGTVSLVEGKTLPGSVADSNATIGSLCRPVDGHDTDNALADWSLCSTPTPGGANAL